MDASKWNTVEVLLVAHLNTTKFKAHDGGIVAYGLKYITPAVFIGPTHTIERIILVSCHIPFLLKCCQMFCQ